MSHPPFDEMEQKRQQMIASFHNLAAALSQCAALVNDYAQGTPGFNPYAGVNGRVPTTAYPTPGAPIAGAGAMTAMPANYYATFPPTAQPPSVTPEQQVAVPLPVPSTETTEAIKPKKGRPAKAAAAAIPAADDASEVVALDSKGKPKKVKTPRDPDMPKRPTAAYFLFQNEVVAGVKAAHPPDMSRPELLRIIASEWAKLSADQREVYDSAYRAEKELYEAKQAEYLQSKGLPAKKVPKAPSAKASKKAAATAATSTTAPAPQLTAAPSASSSSSSESDSSDSDSDSDSDDTPPPPPRKSTATPKAAPAVSTPAPAVESAKKVGTAKKRKTDEAAAADLPPAMGTPTAEKKAKAPKKTKTAKETA